MSVRPTNSVDQLSEEHIREIFDTMDVDNSGHLDEHTIQLGLRKLGLRHTDELTDALWEALLKHDANNDGKVQFEEFYSYCQAKEKNLKAKFDAIDVDRNGNISAAEIQRALQSYGVSANKSDIQKKLQMIDKWGDNDGKIKFEEFRQLSLLFPLSRVDRIFHKNESSWHYIGYYSVPRDSSSRKDNSVSPMTIFVAGGMAGAISRTMTAPADRIKVMMQSSSGKTSSIRSTIKNISAEGSFTAFWKGNGANVAKVIPESSFKFFANDFFKGVIIKDRDNVRIHERLLAGSLAGVTAQTCIYPLEVVKTRIAIAPQGTYNGILSVIKTTFKREGAMSFYKGLGASNLGIIPYAGVDLAVYGTLKANWLKNHADSDPKWWELLVMGSTSSFTGQIFAYPLQLVRTKLQSSGLPGFPVYTGIGHVVRDVVHSHGYLGLYRGIGANFMKGIPAVAIGYLAYEKSIQFVGPVFNKATSTRL
eukprot:m.267536 g.267536  ORF g.267536 m.267536 type:complete len:477 (+) comp73664_c0_seq1:339-1769(+)